MRITRISRRVKAFLCAFTCLATIESSAQTTTADFTNVSSINSSHSTGYKRWGSNFVVNDKLEACTNCTASGTGALSSSGVYVARINNAAQNVTETVTIKAEDGSACKIFRIRDMAMSSNSEVNASTGGWPMDVLTTQLYDYGGNLVATHTLSANMVMPRTSKKSLSTIYSNWPSAGYNQVSKVVITYHYANTTVAANDLTLWTMTYSNVSATAPTTLAVGTISGSPFCAGSTVQVPYTATGINSGNVFTAQLSNAAGSFTSPTSIGQVTSTTSGTINATIPAGTATGTGYRIRVVASNPATTSADNGANLTINALPTASISSVTNVACFGGNTGSVTVGVTGGSTPYNYSWSPLGGTGATASNLSAGTYTVTVQDNNGCQATASQAVTQPSAPVSASTVVTNVSCFGGNTGSINLTPAGGTPGYTFLWNGGATSEDRSNLTAGNYSVTITDANGCQATVSNISVSQPTAAVAGATVVTNVSCFGGNTGSIDLTPAGGTPGYTYLWNGGATSQDRSNLAAGTYSVTITDANGCQGTVSNISVGQPSTAVSGSTVVTNVACFGGNTGAINLTPTGGTPGYTFLWNGGATTEDRTSLAAGTYSVTITDANGCQGTVSNISVGQPTAAVSGSTVVTNVACFGGSNGTINLTPAGGTPGYTFLWNGGATTEDRTGLSSGTYSVTITDANGCQASISNISVSQPAATSASISYSGSPFTLGTGNAAVNFSGSTGGTYSSTTGLVLDAQTGSIDLASSTAGTYTVTYTIANATCGDYSTTASVTLTNPFSATISYAGSPFCDTTRTAMVTFSGTTGGTFSSTPGLVIDPATGMVDLAASTSGTYTVTYGDGNGSTSTQIAVRPSLLMEPVRNQVLCNGAMTNAVTFNTLSGVSVNWTLSGAAIGGPAAGSGTVPAFTALNSAGTPAIGQLTAYPSGGTGCPVKAMVSRITVNPTPVLSTLADQTLCAGSLITPLNFASSVAGTLVSWTNTTPAIGLNPAGSNAIPAFVAQNNTGAPLTATITATPFAAGCYGAATTTTLMVSPAAGSFTYPGSPYCPVGAANPRLLGSTGGTYSAPAGIVFYSTSTGSINLGASTPGTYTVTYTVASSNGCPGTAQTQITIKPQATVNPIRNQLYCNGTMTAPVVFTGTASSYTWTVDNPAIGIGAGSGTQLPSFMTVNAGPGTASAYVKVTPQGNGTSNCLGNPFVFRITVNYCPPVTQSGGTGGTDATARTAASLGAFFEVGPNPARSSTVVRYTGSEQGTFAVQLLTSYGTALGKTATLSGTSTTLDLSGVTPGSYLVRITNTRTGAACVKTLVKL